MGAASIHVLPAAFLGGLARDIALPHLHTPSIERVAQARDSARGGAARRGRHAASLIGIERAFRILFACDVLRVPENLVLHERARLFHAATRARRLLAPTFRSFRNLDLRAARFRRARIVPTALGVRRAGRARGHWRGCRWRINRRRARVQLLRWFFAAWRNAGCRRARSDSGIFLPCGKSRRTARAANDDDESETRPDFPDHEFTLSGCSRA